MMVQTESEYTALEWSNFGQYFRTITATYFNLSSYIVKVGPAEESSCRIKMQCDCSRISLVWKTFKFRHEIKTVFTVCLCKYYINKQLSLFHSLDIDSIKLAMCEKIFDYGSTQAIQMDKSCKTSCQHGWNTIKCHMCFKHNQRHIWRLSLRGWGLY